MSYAAWQWATRSQTVGELEIECDRKRLIRWLGPQVLIGCNRAIPVMWPNIMPISYIGVCWSTIPYLFACFTAFGPSRTWIGIQIVPFVFATMIKQNVLKKREKKKNKTNCATNERWLPIADGSKYTLINGRARTIVFVWTAIILKALLCWSCH